MAMWQRVQDWYFVDWSWNVGVAGGPTSAGNTWQLKHNKFTWFCTSMRWFVEPWGEWQIVQPSTRASC
jgi:hypothetical protein